MSMMKKKWLECCTCGQAICCTGRCFPGAPGVDGNCTGDPSENPLPTTLTVDMLTDDASFGCFAGSTTVTLVANGRWGLGTINATCSWHNPTDSTAAFVTWYFSVQVAIQCTNEAGWGIEFRRPFFETSPHPSFIPQDSTLSRISCDPISLEGTVCYFPGMSSVVFPAVPPQPPLEHPTICLSFSVYETP
jgi:hypothetical protein